MQHSTRRLISISPLLALLGATAIGVAQTPARETPRPQDVDPAVNTSAPSQAPARETSGRETPRPQDIDPAVNTSATPSTDAAPASSSGAAGSAASPSSAAARAARGTSGNASPVSPAVPKAGTIAAKPSSPGSANTADGKPKGKALDRLELDTTQITGNRELPKVLYIVPWKRSDLGDLVGKPVNSLLDEVLTPVDRDVFKRENRYYRALAPAEGQPGGANGAPPSGTAPSGATSSGSAAPAARDER